MRFSGVAAGLAFAAILCASCGGASTPVSPSAAPQAAVATDSGGSTPTGTPATGTESSAVAIGLSGVVRGLNATTGVFSLATRTGTRTILADRQTEVWNKGTQVRLSSLRNGQTVSIRGYDYTRYVLARTIGVN